MLIVTLGYILLININQKDKEEVDRDPYSQVKYNYVDSVLNDDILRAQGKIIDKLILKNQNKIISLKDLYTENKYIIIIYLNGVICDPCLDFVCENWGVKSQSFPVTISQRLTIVQNKRDRAFDRSTIILLKKMGFNDSYWLDVDDRIKSQLKLSDSPTNFILFLNNNYKVIFMDYFSSDSKERFDNFIKKCLDFVGNS